MNDAELLIMKSMSQTTECQKMISELMEQIKQLTNYIDNREQDEKQSISKCPYCHELFSTVVGKNILKGGLVK